MPETEFKDLGEKPAKLEGTVAPTEERKPYYHTLNITQKQIPELEDYDLGDDIHLEIVCRVSRVEKIEDKPKNITLEMRKGRVLNLTEARQKAINRGVTKKTSDEIDASRTKNK